MNLTIFACFKKGIMQVSSTIKQYYKFVIWVMVIGYLCLAPADEFKKIHFNIPYFDKIVHFWLFFILGLLVATIKRYYTSNISNIWLPVFSALYGGLIEWVQFYFTTSRTGDIIDWCADLLGLTLGILAFKYLPISVTRLLK